MGEEAQESFWIRHFCVSVLADGSATFKNRLMNKIAEIQNQKSSEYSPAEIL
jgi:hypothetical protein